MDSDAELMARAKGGDEEAFAEIVKRHLPGVFAFLARYVGDESAAEDAAQETFVKAWRNLSRFDAARPLAPWLFKIARNAGNDLLRGRRAIPFSRFFARSEEDDASFEETIADEEPLPPEVFERKELGREVARALAALPERDRAVLLLRYEEGLTFEEIAETLSAPMNTAKSWHRRALIRLKEALLKNAPKGDTGT